MSEGHSLVPEMRRSCVEQPGNHGDQFPTHSSPPLCKGNARISLDLSGSTAMMQEGVSCT